MRAEASEEHAQLLEAQAKLQMMGEQLSALEREKSVLLKTIEKGA